MFTGFKKLTAMLLAVLMALTVLPAASFRLLVYNCYLR